MHVDATGQVKGSRRVNMARALHSRNFRLFFAGQGVSLIGTWMQRTAMLWLVSTQLSDVRTAALWLGVVGFSSQIPALVLTPLAGVVADRWNRHRIVVVTQFLSMLQAFVLAALTLSGTIEIWHIIALSVWLGAVNAVDVPTRQSFVIQMVDRPEDLNNAIALNSLVVNGGRMLGPALGGVLTALFGAGFCFLLNGVSYLAVLIALLAMRIKPRQVSLERKPILRHLVEGIRYAVGVPSIRRILLMIALVSLVGIPYASLLPVFASHLLAGGPKTYGLLVTGAGVGALMGALYLASRSNVLGFYRIIAIAPAVLGGALIAFSLSRSLVVSLMIMPLLGMAQMLLLASSNTLLQTIVDDDKRGRVMSFYSLSFMGIVPIGNLVAGILASQIGPALTVAIGGCLCIGGALVFSGKLQKL